MTDNPTVTEQTALRLRGDYQTQLDSIRASGGLTPAGKRDAIAELYSQYSGRLAALREQVHGTAEAELRAIEQRLFAMPSTSPETVIAFRDAYDRVESCSAPADALDLFRRAERTGDGLLSRALLAVALERRWVTVIDAYLVAHPGDVDDVRAYLAHQPGRGPRTAARVRESMVYKLSRPTELAR